MVLALLKPFAVPFYRYYSLIPATQVTRIIPWNFWVSGSFSKINFAGNLTYGFYLINTPL
mgnify:CR=1 FL=1